MSIVFLVVAIAGGLLVYIVIKGNIESSKWFGEMKARLRSVEVPDYEFEGFSANRVGESLSRVVIGVFKDKGEVRFITNIPNRDIVIPASDITDVYKESFDVQGKVKHAVCIKTRSSQLELLKVEDHTDRLFNNLR